MRENRINVISRVNPALKSARVNNPGDISGSLFSTLVKKGRVGIAHSYMSGTRYMDGFLAETWKHQVLLSGTWRTLYVSRQPGCTTIQLE